MMPVLRGRAGCTPSPGQHLPIYVPIYGRNRCIKYSTSLETDINAPHSSPASLHYGLSSLTRPLPFGLGRANVLPPFCTYVPWDQRVTSCLGSRSPSRWSVFAHIALMTMHSALRCYSVVFALTLFARLPSGITGFLERLAQKGFLPFYEVALLWNPRLEELRRTPAQG